MMILRSSPPSPYGRKVKIAAAILGLSDRIEVVVADTNDPAEPLRRQNALGKIPTLVLEDGSTLFDSRVIVEYLDMLAGSGRIVPVGSRRFAALRLQALADGILDASLLQIYETRFRAEDRREPKWLALQQGKVDRGLAELERNPPPIQATPCVGVITTACVLGYRDLRFAGDWRAGHPNLVHWLDAFTAQVPAFEATRVKP